MFHNQDYITMYVVLKMKPLHLNKEQSLYWHINKEIQLHFNYLSLFSVLFPALFLTLA